MTLLHPRELVLLPSRVPSKTLVPRGGLPHLHYQFERVSRRTFGEFSREVALFTSISSFCEGPLKHRKTGWTETAPRTPQMWRRNHRFSPTAAPPSLLFPIPTHCEHADPPWRNTNQNVEKQVRAEGCSLWCSVFCIFSATALFLSLQEGWPWPDTPTEKMPQAANEIF